ncbi:MAG: hypothetical protein H6814_04305 [Phycisphaeraceae bacterium]|nr:hypothetical protein [Phycisphaeraceae bacterium]
MSISISASNAVFVPYGRARHAPIAVQRAAGSHVAASNTVKPPASAYPGASSLTGPGATTGADGAQGPSGDAQEGVGSDPGRDPGIQGGPVLFGDINGDDTLNGEDVTALLQAFRSSVSAADLNADGGVDTADLGILINAIREFNAPTKPDNSAGAGPDRTFQELAATPIQPDRIAELKSSAIHPGTVISETIDGSPGIVDDPQAQPGVYGDLTGDGRVDADDLAAIRKSFGSASAAGDLNGDGRVDTADLGALLGLLNKPEEA